MKTTKNIHTRWYKRLRYSLIFVIAGILINFGGRWLAGILASHNITLYLDSIGTILVSVAGGALPGVLTGFISNLINGIQDPINTYYGVISVMLAICASYFSSKKFYDSLPKALSTAFPLTLIGGGLGSVLTFFMSGWGFETAKESGTLIQPYFGPNILTEFFQNLARDLWIDLGDKLITVLIVFLVYKLIKPRVRDYVQFNFWHQNPGSANDALQADHHVSITRSLRYKIVSLILLTVFVIAAATMSISYHLYASTSYEEHTDIATGTADLVAAVVDGDKVDEYLSRGESVPGYAQAKKRMESIRRINNDIIYVYVYKIMEDGCHVVFDLDSPGIEGSEPGEIMEFDESFSPYLDDLLAGKEIKPVESNDTFGWLLTAYHPILDSSGRTAAYACVDISMEEVLANNLSFVTKVVSMFLGVLLIVLIAALQLAEFNLILPLNAMAVAANRFAYTSEEARESSIENFRSLQISTGDEIENLYESFSMTIEETIKYIADIQKKTAELNRMQNGLILVLADMVESRDKCTGDHVRKTAMYCRIILKQLRKMGYYKDQLTDEFIEDVVNSAPLHDVGKIKVSDAILNKPGKLTDEEFDIMKTHTTAGKEIIEEAMNLVSTDSGYLNEAKNLAAYHHEKWNGKGYPSGLSGEEIPLSARVMAVADVFDALVSERSYKKPFSFEQACDIIQKDAGTHFDPKVAEAFLAVKDKAKKIAEANLGTKLPTEYQIDEKA